MRFFLDTSVLIAAVSVQHVHHEPSLAVYLAANKNQAGCAAHSLAEVYATLTRLPGKQRMSCEQTLVFLDEIRNRLKTVVLDGEEYCSAIADTAAEGVLGGMVYDALIARCALKGQAQTIFTWNVDHFRRLGPEVAKRVRTP
ncbi:MAG TPA: PIN domain-containing protein [Terriglobales bacterium]|nr:PIN domain-containing protein [Terriglobales bacterium]